MIYRNLPVGYSGLVWDGVTEYSDPTMGIDDWQNLSFLGMYGDGTRRFYASHGADGHFLMFHFRLYTSSDSRQNWSVVGITFNTDAAPYRDIGFLGYDGTLGYEPVNQIYYREYREHAARAAHQLDAAMGFYSMSSMEESDRLAIYHAYRDVIAVAWLRYVDWYAIDPAELIVGGVYDGTFLWRRNIEEMHETNRVLCGQCDVSTVARIAKDHANIAALKAAHRQGTVYSFNQSTSPWGLVEFDYASQPYSDYYDTLEQAYEDALRYYDTVVGALDVSN